MHDSNRNLQNILHKGSSKYWKSQKKRLLKRSDLRKLVKFCTKVKKYKLTEKLWNNQMSLDIDGGGFQFKKNPRDEPKAFKRRDWRKKLEGLSNGCRIIIV